jgi:murein L,D-transpeptidase YcbB/YkuD
MLPRLLLASTLLLASCDSREPSPPPARFAAEPVAVVQEIADFYRARANRPLWVTGRGVRPEARALARLIASADDHGLNPERYGASRLEAALAAAQSGDASARAQVELLLSRAYPAFVRDLRLPAVSRGVEWVDSGLGPEAPPDAGELLRSAAAEPDLPSALRDALRMNPLYRAVSQSFAHWRKMHPNAPPADSARVRANLDRLRAIPAQRGRYIIVDAGSARLWMIDGDRVEPPMRVIVGKPAMPTPAMAALVRHVVLNPLWNIPPDLARERAKKVLRSGPALLARERIELLSDWGDRPSVVTAAQVNWKAVASGRSTLRMRQRPGGSNVMGTIKFMFPNRRGIYLHDFPDKSLFERADRRLSSGCVRLSDAPRLARWLFGGSAPVPSGSAPEQRVDLPEPVPVYITYLTVSPNRARGLVFLADAYRREPGAEA